MISRSLEYAKKTTNNELALFNALSTNAKTLLADVSNLSGKTLVLNAFGKINAVVVFDLMAYKKQINSAPECGNWTLPEHIPSAPKKEILTKATLEDDLYQEVKSLSPVAGLDKLLTFMSDSEVSSIMKSELKQCSWLENNNKIHNFTKCSMSAKTLLTDIYSESDIIRLVCQVTKEEVKIALIPVVIDGYSLADSSIKDSVTKRFGEKSKVDTYLETTLGKKYSIAVTEPQNVSGKETEPDNKISLPYKEQIIKKSIQFSDGSKLKTSDYDQIGLIYIAADTSSLGLSNYGNIYEPVNLDDGTTLKNRFIILSDLTRRADTEKLGIDPDKKALTPDQVLFAHEYLHGLGLGHASVSPCDYDLFNRNSKAFDFSQACDWSNIERLNTETMKKFKDEFVDYLSFNYGLNNGVMGGTGDIGQEVIPYYQYRMGLLNKKKFTSVSGARTVELHSFDPNTDTVQLIHLKTKNSHFWLWFTAKNNRYDWMMDNSILQQSINSEIFGDGITLATVSTDGDETAIIIPFDYSLNVPNIKGSLNTNGSLFKNGTYSIDNVEITISTSDKNRKKIEFTYK